MSAPLFRRSQLSVFDFGRAFSGTIPSTAQVLRTLKDIQRVQGSAIIIGGFAAIYHGYERCATEIDLLYEVSDSTILDRLSKYFRILTTAKNGWCELVHKDTGMRLRLWRERAPGTKSAIPALKSVKNSSAFASLAGFIWLKLVAGRMRDDGDICEVLKRNRTEIVQVRNKLPVEWRSRFDELIAQTRKELANDPWRANEEEINIQTSHSTEAAPAYGPKKRRKKTVLPPVKR